MSYHTRFRGKLNLSRQLTLDEFNELEANWLDGASLDIPGNSYNPNYSPWTMDKGGLELYIECGGSAYYWETILQLMIDKFFSPRVILLNGKMFWNGEERGDLGRLVVKDSIVDYKSYSEIIKDLDNG